MIKDIRELKINVPVLKHVRFIFSNVNIINDIAHLLDILGDKKPKFITPNTTDFSRKENEVLIDAYNLEDYRDLQDEAMEDADDLDHEFDILSSRLWKYLPEDFPNGTTITFISIPSGTNGKRLLQARGLHNTLRHEAYADDGMFYPIFEMDEFREYHLSLFSDPMLFTKLLLLTTPRKKDWSLENILKEDLTFGKIKLESSLTIGKGKNRLNDLIKDVREITSLRIPSVEGDKEYDACFEGDKLTLTNLPPFMENEPSILRDPVVEEPTPNKDKYWGVLGENLDTLLKDDIEPVKDVRGSEYLINDHYVMISNLDVADHSKVIEVDVNGSPTKVMHIDDILSQCASLRSDLLR